MIGRFLDWLWSGPRQRKIDALERAAKIHMDVITENNIEIERLRNDFVGGVSSYRQQRMNMEAELMSLQTRLNHAEALNANLYNRATGRSQSASSDYAREQSERQAGQHRESFDPSEGIHGTGKHSGWEGFGFTPDFMRWYEKMRDKAFKKDSGGDWMGSNTPSREQSVSFQLLGIEPGASNDKIKKAYRDMVKRAHPDKPNGSDEKFILVKKSYEICLNY